MPPEPATQTKTIPGRLFVPDEAPEPACLACITHLGVGAHHDDLEFMAFHGIVECHGKTDPWFGGVTCTDGKGSFRNGAFAGMSPEDLAKRRSDEQIEAARIGGYGAMIQLDHPSSLATNPADATLRDDLFQILRATRTRIKTPTERTRRENAHFFGSPQEVPLHVITMGIGTILDTRRVVLLATGEGKSRRHRGRCGRPCHRHEPRLRASTPRVGRPLPRRSRRLETSADRLLQMGLQQQTQVGNLGDKQPPPFSNGLVTISATKELMKTIPEPVGISAHEFFGRREAKSFMKS